MSGSGPTKRIDDWKAPDGGKNRAPDGNDRTVVNPGSGGSGGGFDHATQMPDYARPKQHSSKAGSGDQSAPEARSGMDDPVVGWLVVVKGPGQGVGLKLGMGRNTIGRGDDNRVVLDFGDNSISREKHCIVTYEPRGRHFYIQNEGGQHLTYVGETVVLQAQRLHNGERIQIGDTEMRFVAFCGEDFSWDNPK